MAAFLVRSLWTGVHASIDARISATLGRVPLVFEKSSLAVWVSTVQERTVSVRPCLYADVLHDS